MSEGVQRAEVFGLDDRGLGQLLLEGGSIPWLNLAALLGLVPVVGLTAAVLAVAATLRAPLIPALRRE